ncbi:MAG TPA: hypothetical protein VNN10_06180 [Dehalococcoidia bacterium]|nr:hypothetical protein [Dehalococcoidia bacterium]
MGSLARVTPLLVNEHSPRPLEDTLRLLHLIWREGDVREVRIPAHQRYRGVAAGWFDSPDKLAEAITEWDGFGNIFFTLNPVNPDLIARSNNRITRQRDTTPDGEVIRRSLLLIDIDPDRPSGISSTDAELAEARQVRDAALAFLTDTGWPEPLVAMSGNGFYLLYGLDLPNDAESTRLVKGALDELNRRFKSQAAHIDTSVYNAARIAGLIGTMKVKGDQTAERRHRRSEIIRSPEHLEPVTREQLLALGRGTDTKPAGEPPAAIRATPGRRLLVDLLREAGIEYREQPPDAAGVTWYHVRRCPFHGDGRDFECGVGQNLSSGAYAGHCFHPEGAGKGWQEWKAALGLRTGFAALISTPAQVRRRLTDFPRTDSGNAELLAQLYGDRLRYDHGRGRWLLWRETKWAEDKDGEVHRLAKEAVRQRFLAASGLEDPEEKQAQAKFANPE